MTGFLQSDDQIIRERVSPNAVGAELLRRYDPSTRLKVSFGSG